MKKKKESACNAGDMGSISGWEDPLEKGKATHSDILAWSHKELDTTEQLSHLHIPILKY